MARAEQGGAAKVLRDGTKGARETYGALPGLVGAGQLWKAEKGKGMVFYSFPTYLHSRVLNPLQIYFKKKLTFFLKNLI